MKKQRQKIHFVVIALFFFGAGFFFHALFFPYLFTDNFAVITSAQSGESSSSQTEQNKALTKVLYIDGQFSPRVVQIKKSYYISIVNMSEKELMWLTSDNKLLTTPRGYGKSEEVRTILYEPGVYEVSSTLHPTEKLQVIVK